MENMNICVLLTSVGGLVAPGIIENLRRIPEVSRIVGVDASSDAIGFFLVDKSYVVPRGDENGYMDVLWSIIKAESVNLIIPASDEEVLTLSSHFNKKFRKSWIRYAGIKTVKGNKVILYPCWY